MSQENVKILEAAYAAIERDDLDAFLALTHPEIEFHSLIAEADGRTFRGHEGVREWWDAVIQSLGVRPGAEHIEGFRDRGITRMHLAGRIGDVEVPQAMWMAWRVRDGLVIWWATVRTEAEALEAAGLSDQREK
jgi:ketosteroid isomerase-like protein